MPLRLGCWDVVGQDGHPVSADGAEVVAAETQSYEGIR
jgi:hypothetical protein